MDKGKRTPGVQIKKKQKNMKNLNPRELTEDIMRKGKTRATSKAKQMRLRYQSQGKEISKPHKSQP